MPARRRRLGVEIERGHLVERHRLTRRPGPATARVELVCEYTHEPRLEVRARLEPGEPPQGAQHCLLYQVFSIRLISGHVQRRAIGGGQERPEEGLERRGQVRFSASRAGLDGGHGGLGHGVPSSSNSSRIRGGQFLIVIFVRSSLWSATTPLASTYVTPARSRSTAPNSWRAVAHSCSRSPANSPTTVPSARTPTPEVPRGTRVSRRMAHPSRVWPSRVVGTHHACAELVASISYLVSGQLVGVQSGGQTRIVRGLFSQVIGIVTEYWEREQVAARYGVSSSVPRGWSVSGPASSQRPWDR